MSRLTLAIAIAIACIAPLTLLPVTSQEQKKQKTFSTGFKIHKDAKMRSAVKWVKTASYRRLLRRASGSKYDCRDVGLIPPIKDQGNCGSCWDFSGIGICESSAILAGIGKPDGSFGLSEQYVLDCGRNGGCEGDMATSVLDMAVKDGLPTHAEYGPYRGSSGNCKQTDPAKRVKFHEWGYVTPDPESSDTQAIKDHMITFGPISVAVAADGAFMNYEPGTVFVGNSQDINHEVILIGWDDSKGKHGAWLLRNSWSEQWGDRGYMWISYGSNSVGTYATWIFNGEAPPPPPPGPGPVNANKLVLGSDLKAGTYEIGGESPLTLRAFLLRQPVPTAVAKTGVTPDQWAVIIAEIIRMILLWIGG